MKDLLISGLIFLLFLKVGIVFSQQDNSKNYIITRTFKQSGSTIDSVNKVDIKVSYFDGLGRPLQDIDVMKSPSGNDIIQHYLYDQVGRPGLKYLPYTKMGYGAFQASAITEIDNWYAANTLNFEEITSLDLNRPYAETKYENSPLSRPISQRAPGGRSLPDSISYRTNNADEVKRYDYDYDSNSILQNNFYGAGTLSLVQSEDEQGNITIEYTDMAMSKLICTKVQLETSSLDTYYVYDDIGLLRGVLQPKYQENPSPDFVFSYDYDEQGRVIRKHIPGAGVTEIIYDQFDRPILTLTPNLSQSRRWMYTKYDALNRHVITGVTNYEENLKTRQDWITEIEGNSNHHENRNNGTLTGYSLNQTVPVNQPTLLTINFYDDYEFQRDSVLTYDPPLGYTASANYQVKGYQTGIRTEFNGELIYRNGEMATYVYYYDSNYRDIQSVEQVPQMGPYARQRISTRYKYNLSNVQHEVKTSHERFANAGLDSLNILTKTYEYDHGDRILSVKERAIIGVKDKTATTIAYRYNALGQLESKWFHATPVMSNKFRARTDYTYNMRGWITEEKTSYRQVETGPDLNFFSYALAYENPSQANHYSNGNISAMEWRRKDQSTYDSGLNYSFDKANRIVSSTGLHSYSDTENNITYDKNGNILSLNRSGVTTDELTYTYTSGNQVSSITDNSGNNSGLGNGTTTYSYDGNGNVSNTSNINSFTHSTLYLPHINLPWAIIPPRGSRILYTYNSLGTKLEMNQEGVRHTVYVGPITYESLSRGYSATRIESNVGQIIPMVDSLRFEYYIKDHLGNVRLVFDENGDILQESDYYPFGLSIARTGNDAVNRYQYNGKEKQPETGFLDYGARMYMPEIGRWGVVDRYSEKYYDFSPFSYGANNPLRFVDINGDSLHVSQSLINNSTAFNAWTAFSNTKQGRKFLSNFAKAGQKAGDHTFTKDGKYHKKGINLIYKSENITNSQTSGETNAKVIQNGMNVTITIDNDKERTLASKVITIFHESFIHAENNAMDYRDNNKLDYSNLSLTPSQKASVLNYSNHYHHVKVRDDYRKFGLGPKNTNLWPLEGLRGIIEANKSLNLNSNVEYNFNKMWNYNGGLNTQ